MSEAVKQRELVVAMRGVYSAEDRVQAILEKNWPKGSYVLWRRGRGECSGFVNYVGKRSPKVVNADAGKEYWIDAYYAGIAARNSPPRNPRTIPMTEATAREGDEAMDYVMVPRSAIKWLLGEGPDADGLHFGDDPRKYDRGKYWWRIVFRNMLAAASPPPSAGGEVEEVRKRLDAVVREFGTAWAYESCGEKGDGANMVGVMFHPDDENAERPLLGRCDPIYDEKAKEYRDYYRDELIAEVEHRNRGSHSIAEFICHAPSDIATLLRSHASLQSEVERLKRALETYAEHDRECQLNTPWKYHKGCDCGLSKALEAVG